MTKTKTATSTGIKALMLMLAMSGVAAASEIPYTAKPYEHNGVAITVEKIFLKKDKLWVRVVVINETGKILTVDKAQITAKLANGSLVPRESGTFGGNPKPVSIMSGLSHPIYVEFIIGTPQSVSLVLHGFVVEGKPLLLPDFPMQPAG